MSINHAVKQNLDRNGQNAQIFFLNIFTYLQSAWKKLVIASILRTLLDMTDRIFDEKKISQKQESLYEVIA